MFDRLFRYWGKLPYHGAGILFAHRGPDGWEVLLVRRAIDPDRGVWSVPGGACDRGESYRDAAAREAKEEVLGDRELLGTLGSFLSPGFTMSTAAEEVQYNIPLVLGWRNYLVELLEKPPNEMFRLNWENDGLSWFPAKRLPENTHSGVRSSVRHFGLASG